MFILSIGDDGAPEIGGRFCQFGSVRQIGVSIDDHIGKKPQDFRATVFPDRHHQQFRVFPNEIDGRPPCLKIRIFDQVFQEPDVRFHAPNPEFEQPPEQAFGRLVEGAPLGCYYHQQAVEIRRNL